MTNFVASCSLPSALALCPPMSSRRVLKAAEAIREVVSMAILTDLRDPRIEGVTVTYVEVSPDMRQAKVHVSIMGDDAQQQLCLHGLRSSAGYLQSKISDRIDTRYTPRLQIRAWTKASRNRWRSARCCRSCCRKQTTEATDEADPSDDEN